MKDLESLEEEQKVIKRIISHAEAKLKEVVDEIYETKHNNLKQEIFNKIKTIENPLIYVHSYFYVKCYCKDMTTRIYTLDMLDNICQIEFEPITGTIFFNHINQEKFYDFAKEFNLKLDLSALTDKLKELNNKFDCWKELSI